MLIAAITTPRGKHKRVSHPRIIPMTMNHQANSAGARSNDAFKPDRPALPVWLGFCWIPYLYTQKNTLGTASDTRGLPQEKYGESLDTNP